MNWNILKEYYKYSECLFAFLRCLKMQKGGESDTAERESSKEKGQDGFSLSSTKRERKSYLDHL